MESRGFDDVAAFRGRLAAAYLHDRESILRAQYIGTLTGYQSRL